MKILVTSCGGPAGHNMVSCLKHAPSKEKLIVGCDCNKYHLQLSNADIVYRVHHASEARDEYIHDLLAIVDKHDLEMVYPQSDREVYVCALAPELEELTLLPRESTVKISRDKLLCNQKLRLENVPAPVSWPVTRENIQEFQKKRFPLWVRSRVGAGGYMSAKCEDYRQLEQWVGYWWRHKSSLQWMAAEYLEGDSYSFNCLMNRGRLVKGFLKRRIEWVFGRIGTTCVQEIVNDMHIQDVAVRALTALDRRYTGLAMVDLMEDKVTEVNAGRLGTTADQFCLMFGERGNLPYLAYRLFIGAPPDKSEVDSPDGLLYLRHIDMGRLITDRLEFEEV